MKLESGVARKSRKLFLYAFFSICGLSFWFFLGFPFANHNESYGWIAQMNRMSVNILDVLRWSPAVNYRPLGSITAWLGFRLSNGSIYPQQVFNFIVAILAWLILYSAITEKKLFSWISFIVGGVFFSGYIYLFHLHGVFYSPLLAFIAILTGISVRNGCITNLRLAVIFTLAILTSLYHPFAMLIYVAFTLGYFLENQHTTTRIQLAMGGLFLAVALVLVKILVPTQGSFLPSEWVLGLSTSYKLAELKSVFSIISWLLSVTTVLSLSTSWRVKVITSIIVTVFSLVFVFLNQPVLILWIAVCLVKTALLKKWSMVFLVASTAILPVATATGSPTYTVFVLMVCSAIIPFRWSLSTIESDSLNKIVFAILILVCSVGVLLKSNIHLPVITELVNPITAEREKTFQLECIIRWWQASDYAQYRLVLCQSADNPVASTNVVNRQNRAPTSQVYLDQYTSSLTPLRNENIAGQLLVCFGDEKIAGVELLYTIPGMYSGQAIIYIQHK
jgi:hypothetical protein